MNNNLKEPLRDNPLYSNGFNINIVKVNKKSSNALTCFKVFTLVFIFFEIGFGFINIMIFNSKISNEDCKGDKKCEEDHEEYKKNFKVAYGCAIPILILSLFISCEIACGKKKEWRVFTYTFLIAKIVLFIICIIYLRNSNEDETLPQIFFFLEIIADFAIFICEKIKSCVNHSKYHFRSKFRI